MSTQQTLKLIFFPSFFGLWLTKPAVQGEKYCWPLMTSIMRPTNVFTSSRSPDIFLHPAQWSMNERALQSVTIHICPKRRWTTASIYVSRCRSRASCIMKDTTHPLFVPLPSVRRLRSIKARMSQLKSSYFPETDKLNPQCLYCLFVLLLLSSYSLDFTL